MTVLIDRDFYDTGWKKVPFSHSPSPGSEVTMDIEVRSTGDAWDRLGAIALNGCEILRFATPFDSTLKQTVTVKEPIASMFRYSDGEALLTTYAAGGGGWHEKITYESNGSPSYYGIPVLFLETMNQDRRSLKSTVNAYADYIVFNLTGHSSQEGSYSTFEILVDGRSIWKQRIDWHWAPGCGYITPWVLELHSNVGEIELRSPDCGNYWKASLWLAHSQPVGVDWTWLLLALGMAPVAIIAGVVAGQELGKRF